MTNRKGPRFETELLNGLRQSGLDVERLRLAGKLDEGDLVIKDLGHVYVVEAKATARIDLPGYIAEAKAEAINYAAARGVNYDSVTPIVIVKRRGRGLLDAYVVTDVRTFFDLG